MKRVIVSKLYFQNTNFYFEQENTDSQIEMNKAIFYTI